MVLVVDGNGSLLFVSSKFVSQLSRQCESLVVVCISGYAISGVPVNLVLRQ